MEVDASSPMEVDASSPRKVNAPSPMEVVLDPLQQAGIELRVIESSEQVWRAQLYDSYGVCLKWIDIISMLNSHLGREAFNYSITTVPFEAFTWEAPVLCSRSLHLDFAMAAFKMDPKDYKPIHRSIFKEIKSSEGAEGAAVKFYAKHPQSGTISMMTELICPCDIGGLTQGVHVQACRHLKSFTKSASSQQQHAFWLLVGEELNRRSQDSSPTWVCTEGTGVHWLHFRLQRRPMHINTPSFQTVPAEPCLFFAQGRCNRGTSCTFSHE